MITAWRIAAADYADSAFDGEGAFLYGGRWNSRGVRMVYTSASAALASLELLVRIRQKEPLSKYILFACSFAEDIIETVDREHLPDDWRLSPAPAPLQQLGDSWVHSGASAVMRVPSAIIDSEFNYLFNPAHAEFAKIEIADPTPFSLDVRLLRT